MQQHTQHAANSLNISRGQLLLQRLAYLLVQQRKDMLNVFTT